MIERFDRSCFKPVSYELRLGSASALAGVGEKSQKDEMEVPDLREVALPYVMKPGEYLLGKSVESLNLPANLMAFVVPTSFAIRIGLGINSGKIDPTYRGEVHFGIYNLTQCDIQLSTGMRLVHLLVSEFKGEIIPLETKYFGAGVDFK